MTIPDVIRRAIEAQGKIDPAAVEAALGGGPDPIPTDADEALREEARRNPPEPAATPEKPVHAAVEGFQTTLDGEILRPIRYEALLPSPDVETYKRVKRWTMNLANDARAILADMTGGTIGDGGRSNKQFLTTGRGKWRVAMGHNSDNTTEVEAMTRMGVEFLHLDTPEEVLAFFDRHDLPPRECYDSLVRRLTRTYLG